MNIDLKGKIVLITGAAGGIGRETSRLLAKSGAQVIAHCREQNQNFEQWMNQLPGGNHRVLYAELRHREQISDMFETVRRELGRLDVLINNAGYSPRSPFVEVANQALDEVMEVNFVAPFLCAREAAKLMIDQGGGKILFVGSIDGERPGSNRAHYSSAKAAELQLMRSLSVELAEYHILVNAVSPGAIDTKMTTEIKQDNHFYERVRKGIPLHRFGDPIEIASMLLFLSSDFCGYTTGANIVIDGGLSLTRGY